jgi:hypothetical protein
MTVQRSLYGLVAEFGDADTLRAAVAQLCAEGYRELDAYSPFAVEGLAEQLRGRRSRLPWVMFAGALFGGIGTYVLEWYSAVIDYPIDVGGRPPASWPLFLPPAIEMTVLWAAIAGVAALFLRSGLPRMHHPLFVLEAFEAASRDRFFLVVRSDDPLYGPIATRECLEQQRPLAVREVLL